MRCCVQVWLGDLNVANEDIDLANPKGNVRLIAVIVMIDCIALMRLMGGLIDDGDDVD